MSAFGVLAVLPLVRLHPAGGVLAPALGRGPLVHVDVRWSVALTALWLGVSVYRLAGLAVNGWRLWSVWRRAETVEADESLAGLLVHGGRQVELCVSDEVERPSLIGFFSPRIVVPDWLFERLSEVELRQIVMHEMEHLRRGDDWINLVQKICLVAFPLNPVLVWIERRLCLERELACDDDVLRLTKAPKAYATCLTNLAEQRLGRRAAALSLGAWERQPELVRRVHSILRGAERMGRTQARVVMSALVLGLLGGSAELARCPQLVSFSRAALPASAEVQRLPETGAGYQPVAFHVPNDVAGNASGAPRQTLLKASMPVDRGGRGLQSASKPAVKHRRAVHALAVQRSGQDRAAMPQVRRWVVLTSWQQPSRPGVIFAVGVDRDREFSYSYAAVPTAGGWLVIQL
jgi:hypothetical protein